MILVTLVWLEYQEEHHKTNSQKDGKVTYAILPFDNNCCGRTSRSFHQFGPGNFFPVCIDLHRRKMVRSRLFPY